MKWGRHYSDEIIEKTFKFWKVELEKVPEEMRGLARAHLMDFYLRYIKFTGDKK